MNENNLYICRRGPTPSLVRALAILSENQTKIFYQYCEWLDKTTTINIDTFARFISNLHSDVNDCNEEHVRKKELRDLVVFYLGYDNYTQCINSAQPLNKIKTKSIVDGLVREGIKDNIGYFFVKETTYVEEIMIYLQSQYKDSKMMSTEEFFNLFATVYQNILLLPIFKDTLIGEEYIKPTARKCFIWHMRKCIDREILFRTAKLLPKIFKEKYCKVYAVPLE